LHESAVIPCCAIETFVDERTEELEIRTGHAEGVGVALDRVHLRRCLRVACRLEGDVELVEAASVVVVAQHVGDVRRPERCNLREVQIVAPEVVDANGLEDRQLLVGWSIGDRDATEESANHGGSVDVGEWLGHRVPFIAVLRTSERGNYSSVLRRSGGESLIPVTTVTTTVRLKAQKKGTSFVIVRARNAAGLSPVSDQKSAVVS